MSSSNGVGGKGGGAPAAAASAPAPSTAAQSRRAMLEEYRRQKQLQKQQQQQQPSSKTASSAASASASAPRTAQGLRSKIQGLKSPPPAKRATASSSTSASTAAATKRGSGAAASSSSSVARKPMAAVDKKKIQQAGERAVAPGTPVHSLQKRLRLRSPLAGRKAASGKYVPVESKVAAIFKKPAPGSASSSSASPAKQQAEQEVIEVVDAAPQAKVQKGGKTLAALVEEATALARGGFLPASRALLENTGEEHRCKALYWAARARLEEEQEGKDWDRAADLLEEGLICVARDEAEAAMLRATRKEFLDRRTRAALASVENLLEAEEDALPAPVPTPMKKGAHAAAEGEMEEESEDDDSDEDAVPRMSLTPAKPTPRRQQQQKQQQQRTPASSQAKPQAQQQPSPAPSKPQEEQARRLSTLSTSSGSSVPSLRLPGVVPVALAAPAAEDNENAPAPGDAGQRSSLSSSDTLPKPAIPVAVAGVAGGAVASPSPAKKTLVRTSLGSPQRSPSPAKPLGPFQSPLAGGAVRVPTGSTGRSLLGKGAVRRPSPLMSPTNILRSGSAKRVPTPAIAHADDNENENEEEEAGADGAYASPALKLFYGAHGSGSPSLLSPSARFCSPSMPLPQAMQGDYGYDYGNEEEGDEEDDGQGQGGEEEGYYYEGQEDDDGWAADGANEWSPEALAAMEDDGGMMDMTGDGGEGAAEEAAAMEKALLARMLMPPPLSAGRRSSGARRSSLSTGAARVLMSKDDQQQRFACPPMEMDATSGERKRTPVVSRYPRSSKVYTDSLEGLSPGGATLLAAVPRTNPDGTRVYTPVRRSTRLLSAAINSSGKKGQSHGKAQATPSPLRRDMERLLSDMRPLNLHDE